MKKYKKPQSIEVRLQMEQLIATSPGIKDELGGEEQLSNQLSGWDNPDWAEEE